MAILPVVIAGGKGERLWPLSTYQLPKPFLKLGRGRWSLFQEALLRAQLLEGSLPALVVCNNLHHELAAKQAAEAGVVPPTFVVEQSGRNTGPAICVAALMAQDIGQQDAAMIVLAADHEITETENFLTVCRQAAKAAERGDVVLFAIPATSPATAYGYLRLGPGDGLVDVLNFIEKPDATKAKKLLESGDYAWNSGMFCFTAQTILKAFAQLQPDMLAACIESLGQPTGTVVQLDPDSFYKAPSISVDYAIMEKLGGLRAIRSSIGWSDLGDWAAVHSALKNEEQGNAVRGPAEAVQCRNCLVVSSGPRLLAVGFSNLAVIATTRVLQLVEMDMTQRVRPAPTTENMFSVINLSEDQRFDVPMQDVALVVVLEMGCSLDAVYLGSGWSTVHIASGQVVAGDQLFSAGQDCQRPYDMFVHGPIKASGLNRVIMLFN